ncbi:hypothetical protein DYB37_006414 [Aphanomyces astaci]|uniref:tRNA-specific 2-thiouridylase MnmA-like C-terminal domain-containing protein n=1 Tax=Aphanomyces astaci TaxID=112090 RepID=A0A418EW91_APHAT|nr:hypothetical protein DYB37_006414 [Aphanomyces astaci]
MYMNNWDTSDEEGHATCPADMEYEAVRQVCNDIGIPCTRVDFVQEYWNNVFAPCLDEYAQGFTPNPDVLCNREIKFDAFARHAKHVGADAIATGHYAQLLPMNDSASSTDSDALRLFAAVDTNKDQTYFLSHVSADAFQQARAKVPGQAAKWFVVGKRDQDAAVLVAPGTHHPALFADHTYRQPLAGCTVTIVHDLDATDLHPARHNHQQLSTDTYLKVDFDVPQRGLAPGQSVVLYRQDGLCFGGGAIYCAGPSYWEMRKPLPSPLHDWHV